MGVHVTPQLILRGAFLPVVEVLLLIGTGALMTRMGVIDGGTRTAMSKLVANVFTPALSLVKIAGAMTPSTLVRLWPAPLGVAVNIAIGTAAGWVAVRLTRPERRLVWPLIAIWYVRAKRRRGAAAPPSRGRHDRRSTAH